VVCPTHNGPRRCTCREYMRPDVLPYKIQTLWGL
jgi:hypothetical protein